MQGADYRLRPSKRIKTTNRPICLDWNDTPDPYTTVGLIIQQYKSLQHDGYLVFQMYISYHQSS